LRTSVFNFRIEKELKLISLKITRDHDLNCTGSLANVSLLHHGTPTVPRTTLTRTTMPRTDHSKNLRELSFYAMVVLEMVVQNTAVLGDVVLGRKDSRHVRF
jgi:hypothetical protein